MRSPVLFLVFNRPAPTARVFEVIRAARPPRLYVAADGARANRAGEAERCEQTRKVATTVDWPCDVRTLFRDHNLGCKQAVSQAIDWYFEHEPEGVILEDDCVADPSFFPYCDELLERYREDERIALISGDNFQFGRTYGDASYYFSRYVHIWGWASWRRTWRHYDRDAGQWPAFLEAGGLRKVLGARPQEIRHWHRVFAAVHAGKIDTWDYQLNLAIWANGMRSILPRHNLVSNIGFGVDATHTNSISKFADMATAPLPFPLRHPADMQENAAADDFTANQMFLRSFARRALGRVRTLGRRLFGT
jgi:hypothetical protein